MVFNQSGKKCTIMLAIAISLLLALSLSVSALTEDEKYKASCVMLDGGWGTEILCESDCRDEGKTCEVLLFDKDNQKQPYIDKNNLVCYKCVDIPEGGEDEDGVEGTVPGGHPSDWDTPDMTAKEWEEYCAKLGGKGGSMSQCKRECEEVVQGGICNVLIATDDPNLGTQPTYKTGTTNTLCYKCDIDPATLPTTGGSTGTGGTGNDDKKDDDDKKDGETGDDGKTREKEPELGKGEKDDKDTTPGQPAEKSKPKSQPEEDWVLDCPTRPPKSHAFSINYLHHDHRFKAEKTDKGWASAEKKMGGDGKIDIVKDIPINIDGFNKAIIAAVKKYGAGASHQINDAFSRKISGQFQKMMVDYFKKQVAEKDIQCEDPVLVALEAHGVPKYTGVKVKLKNGDVKTIPVYIGNPYDTATGKNGKGIPRDAQVLEKTHSGWYFTYKKTGMKASILINGKVLDAMLREIKSCYVTFVTDACFSGSIKYHQFITRPGVNVFMGADAFHPAVAVKGIPLYSYGFQKSIAKNGGLNPEKAHEDAKAQVDALKSRMNDEYKKRIANQNPQSYRTKRSCKCPCPVEDGTYTDPPEDDLTDPDDDEEDDDITPPPEDCSDGTYEDASTCKENCYNGQCMDVTTGKEWDSSYEGTDSSCYGCKVGPACEDGTYTKLECDVICDGCEYAEIGTESRDETPCYTCAATCPDGTYEGECPSDCTSCPTFKTLADGTECLQCVKETCPDGAHVDECPSECDDCNIYSTLSDGTECLQCVKYECPDGTYKGECPDSCEACQPAYVLGNDEKCYVCGTVSCVGDTWKTKAECESGCDSYYSGCEVAYSEGSVECWGCGDLDCDAWCESQGYVEYSVSAWSDYILGYLNENGYCKNHATITRGTVSKGNCKCAKKPTVTVSGEATCIGTSCGDVPCGQSKTCSCGTNCQMTVNCNWVGWTWQNQKYVAITGAE